MVEARKEGKAAVERDNITVGVRVRPPLPRELADRAFNDCVAVDKQSSKIFVSLENKPVVIS